MAVVQLGRPKVVVLIPSHVPSQVHPAAEHKRNTDIGPGVSNLFRPTATERKYSGGEGHIVNFSLIWGLQHQYFQMTLFQIPMNHCTMKSQ